MLALWAVVGICARKRLPLPRGVGSRVLRIANTLLRYAIDETPRARALVPDLVLDTLSEPGRGTPFEKYKLEKRNADIVARVRELLIKDQTSLERGEKVRPGKGAEAKRSSRASKINPVRRRKSHALPEIRTQTAVYEQVFR